MKKIEMKVQLQSSNLATFFAVSFQIICLDSNCACDGAISVWKMGQFVYLNYNLYEFDKSFNG